MPFMTMACTYGAWMSGGGREGSHGWHRITHRCGCKIMMARNLLCQPKDWCWVPVRLLVLQRTRKSITADHSWVWPCNHNCDPNVNTASQVRNGFIYFLAMGWTKFENSNMDFLPCIPSTEITNRDKCFCFLWQFLPWLYFFIFYHQSRRNSFVSNMHVSLSELESLTSVIASLYLYNNHQMIKSPLVSKLSLPWRISLYDLLRPWWTRGFLNTSA